MSETYQAPPHYFDGSMPHDFAAVVSAEAVREGRTFTEQLVQMAIDGAEHRRLCQKERR
jgi:hypothetical protein